tara:strand:+ start:1748 stop:1981 length:234 start_codon:yes stop_codon:yes gene_type:complete
MDKDNLIEDPKTGIRAYELYGMRYTFPKDWTDEMKDEWFERARNDMHLRRQLKMFKKNGVSTVLRAFREHGDRHGET